jgi:NADH-quinone oxidoreductase subunit H
MQTVFSHPLFLPLLMTVIILAAFPLVAGYMVLVERKVLADLQVRLGPMRVGPHGFLQPIADALKLFFKEDIIPMDADRALFWFAPCISCFTALTAFAVLPFSATYVIADVNVGILVISAMSAVGILGIILGGWASNSHYPLLGALRSAAQLVSYEVALALAILSGIMAAGTLSMVEIVRNQQARHIWFVFDNYGFMIVPFIVYVVAAVAETNRVPFDLPEAESELVAGYHTEYSGFRWALFMLSEYAALFVMCAVMVTVFWGGWLRPFPSVGFLEIPLNVVFPIVLFVGSGLWCLPRSRKLPYAPHRPFLAILGLILIAIGFVFAWPAANAAIISLFWFLFKVWIAFYSLIWVRGTFPRFRYDQLMNVGWKVMIPIALAAIAVNAVIGVASAAVR